jgi:hypothetical protein
MKLIRDTDDLSFCHANMKYYYEKENRFVETAKKCPTIVDGQWYFWEYNRGILVHISNLVFNKEKALKTKVFEGEDEYIGGDSELIGKLALLGKVGFVEKTANVYRYHGENDTFTAKIGTIFGYYKSFDKIRAFALAIDPGLEEKLDDWKSNRIGMFMKVYFCVLMKNDKRKAFEFMKMSYKSYKKEFYKVYTMPSNIILLFFAVILNEKYFAWAHRFYNNMKRYCVYGN